MGVSANINRFTYPILGSIIVFMGNTFFPIPFKSAALAFSSVTTDPVMQLNILDAMIIGFFLILGFATTRGIRGEGASRERHRQAAQGH